MFKYTVPTRFTNGNMNLAVSWRATWENNKKVNGTLAIRKRPHRVKVRQTKKTHTLDYNTTTIKLPIQFFEVGYNCFPPFPSFHNFQPV